ncbi:hypothetical protein N8077_05575, partial [Myxococcota bacterium]|nr:hypothetical protein [Myxococcota bacterium]
MNTRGSGISLTTETGGYYAQAPFANFRLELFDLKTDRVVWIATAKTKGEVGVDRSELVLSLARNTLLRLSEDRVVRTVDGYLGSSKSASGTIQGVDIDGVQRWFDIELLLTNDPQWL